MPKIGHNLINLLGSISIHSPYFNCVAQRFRFSLRSFGRVFQAGKMKIILILSALLAVAVAQQPVGLTCNYFFSFETYRCELTINNPNGLDDFNEVGGIHLEGFSNANVTYVYRTAGFSPNVPRIICDSFPNLSRVMFYNTGLNEITDSSFAGCSQITELDLVLNQISSITPNAFSTLTDLTFLYLEANNLRTLPEDLFANQDDLILLDLNYNPLDTLPANVFRSLGNLRTLFLGYANLEAVNNQWFTSNPLLDYLYLAGNRIALAADSFAGLTQLTYLNLARNGLDDIPAGTFAPLQNLDFLYLYGNNFVELEENSFPDLANLDYLDISDNPTVAIFDGAFQGLGSLTSLSLSNCRIRVLSEDSFDGLDSLVSLTLNFNDIEELPPGVFESVPNLSYLGLWNNRVKTLRRSIFGSLANLETVDLDGNIVNALDRTIIDDAVRLNTLYFNGNLCANNYFGNFLLSRNQYLVLLQRCFDNMRFIVDTTTEANGLYSFFDGPQPGIVVRVNTDSEVQIALTPFSFEWSPMVEIFIGTANNTRSVIRINQDTDVVTVPTPNIVELERWNDFRVTWANQVVLVYRGNDQFPFMGYTMRDFFPVNFYGLRAVDTTAIWSVQPVDSQPEGGPTGESPIVPIEPSQPSNNLLV